MSQIRSRKRSPSAPLLALLAALPAAALAQQETSLPAVTVKEAAEVPYKADTSANPKYTQPLLDTPKTIQVIKKEILEEQGALTLMEALRNTPGITMQLGENGNTSAGDTFQMRGASTQQSTFVDGVRDLGTVTRDTFNLEQIEVVKGAAGAENGRGTSTGYINLISKQAHLGDETSMTGTVGTANKKRVTADLNRQLSEDSAFRMNLMAQDSGVDGRDVIKNSGQGVALAFSKGLGSPTRLSVYSQHMRQDNIPDGGLPTIGMPGYYYRFGTNLTGAAATALTNAGGVNSNYNTNYPAVQAAIQNGARVNRNNFYGSASDYERVDAHMVTAKVEHDIDQNTTVRNVTRLGRNHMDRVLTGVNSGSGASSSATSNIGGNIYSLGATPSADPSTWAVGTARQGVDQVNSIIANQTSLSTKFNAVGLEHTLITGVELIREEQTNLGFTNGAITYVNLYNPDPNSARPAPTLSGAKTSGNTTTVGLYVFDQAKINEQYAINGGVRMDRYKLATRTIDAAGVTAALDDERTLMSWNIGGVYKPVPNGSIYVSYADAKTPPGGDNFVLSSSATSQANASFDPLITRTAELGSKWELLDKRLNLSAALFRSVTEGQISYDLGSTTPIPQGKKQVQGLELAAVGQLTRYWQVMSGVAMMSAKQLDQRSSGSTTQISAIGYTPDLSATVWTSYQLERLSLGMGARYLSEQKRAHNSLNDATLGQGTTALAAIPSYTVVDAMVSYQVNPKTSVRLNIYNLFDRDYIQNLNNEGTRMLLGAPRSAALTVSYKF